MNRPSAVTILAGLGIGVALAGHPAAALVFVIAALLTELLGPNTSAEDAYQRNHAHKEKR